MINRICKEANLLNDLVADYSRYKTQGHIQTAHRVLQLIKQTIDNVIEKPELFAEPVQGVMNVVGSDLVATAGPFERAAEAFNKTVPCSIAEVPLAYQENVEGTVEFSHKEENVYSRPIKKKKW